MTVPNRLDLQLYTEHEANETCYPYHCEWHHVDEIPEGETAYLGCGECGHLYQTPRELRRAYRRAVWETERDAPLFGDEYRQGKLLVWWRLLTVRASRVTFCQHCVHDF